MFITVIKLSKVITMYASMAQDHLALAGSVFVLEIFGTLAKRLDISFAIIQTISLVNVLNKKTRLRIGNDG